jgi:hypothetical protein
LIVQDKVDGAPSVIELGETLIVGGTGAFTVRVAIAGWVGDGQVRV